MDRSSRSETAKKRRSRINSSDIYVVLCVPITDVAIYVFFMLFFSYYILRRTTMQGGRKMERMRARERREGKKLNVEN